jgi:hypothetical protein
MFSPRLAPDNGVKPYQENQPRGLDSELPRFGIRSDLGLELAGAGRCRTTCVKSGFYPKVAAPGCTGRETG